MQRPSPHSSPTPAQRAALLRFEELYEEWRVACVNLLEAEEQLLAASLGASGEVPAELAEHVARLREIEGAARLEALAARDEMGE